MTRTGSQKPSPFRAGWVAGAWYAAALMLLAIGVMGYLWPQHRIVEMGYTLEALEARRAEVIRLHRMLSLEAASLAALPRIERIATSQLGMVFPEPDQVRTVHHHSDERMTR